MASILSRPQCVKSPQYGVTLCFQFISVIAAKTLAFHVKPMHCNCHAKLGTAALLVIVVSVDLSVTQQIHVEIL